jgi:ADP-ribose pyrophosphatase YjhB (NUDIX family)
VAVLEITDVQVTNFIEEIKEEVGVEAEITRLVGVYWKVRQQEVVFQFEGRIVAGKPTPSDEADQIAFFEPEQLPSNLSPSQRERIHHALRDHPHVLLVTQDHPSSREFLGQSHATH